MPFASSGMRRMLVLTCSVCLALSAADAQPLGLGPPIYDPAPCLVAIHRDAAVTALRNLTHDIDQHPDDPQLLGRAVMAYLALSWCTGPDGMGWNGPWLSYAGQAIDRRKALGFTPASLTDALPDILYEATCGRTAHAAELMQPWPDDHSMTWAAARTIIDRDWRRVASLAHSTPLVSYALIRAYADTGRSTVLRDVHPDNVDPSIHALAMAQTKAFSSEPGETLIEQACATQTLAKRCRGDDDVGTTEDTSPERNLETVVALTKQPLPVSPGISLTVPCRLISAADLEAWAINQADDGLWYSWDFQLNRRGNVGAAQEMIDTIRTQAPQAAVLPCAIASGRMRATGKRPDDAARFDAGLNTNLAQPTAARLAALLAGSGYRPLRSTEAPYEQLKKTSAHTWDTLMSAQRPQAGLWPWLDNIVAAFAPAQTVALDRLERACTLDPWSGMLWQHRAILQMPMPPTIGAPIRHGEAGPTAPKPEFGPAPSINISQEQFEDLPEGTYLLVMRGRMAAGSTVCMPKSDRAGIVWEPASALRRSVDGLIGQARVDTDVTCWCVRDGSGDIQLPTCSDRTARFTWDIYGLPEAWYARQLHASLKPLLTDQPWQTDLGYYVAAWYHARRDDDQAAEVIKPMWQAEPLDPQAARVYAAALANTGRAAEAVAVVDAVIASKPRGLEMAWFNCFAGYIHERNADIDGATACYMMGAGSGAGEPRLQTAHFLVRARRFGDAASMFDGFGDPYYTTESVYCHARNDPSYVVDDEQLDRCACQGAYGFAGLCVQIARLSADRLSALSHRIQQRQANTPQHDQESSLPPRGNFIVDAINYRTGVGDSFPHGFSGVFIPDLNPLPFNAIAGVPVDPTKGPQMGSWERWLQFVVSASQDGNWAPVVVAARTNHHRAAIAVLAHAFWASKHGRPDVARAGYQRIIASYDDDATAFGLATLFLSRDPAKPIEAHGPDIPERGWEDMIVPPDAPPEPQ